MEASIILEGEVWILDGEPWILDGEDGTLFLSGLKLRNMLFFLVGEAGAGASLCLGLQKMPCLASRLKTFGTTVFFTSVGS